MQYLIYIFLLAFSLNVYAALPETSQKPANPVVGITPADPAAKQASAALALQQAQKVTAEAAQLNGAKLWFGGFGLHSGSGAFRGDVLLANQRMHEAYPQTLSYLFDNQPQAKQLSTPFAHLGAITETVNAIARQARPGDVVTLMLTSHGNVKLLVTQIGRRSYANIADYHLATALAPLKDIPTVLIVSACHSGSLIPVLKSANRIILTAAAEDKASYGCEPMEKNTFFIDALFGAQHNPKLSLHQEFEATRARIATREKELALTPSDPQIFIGENMKAFAEKPQNAWFSTAAPDAAKAQ